MTNHTDLIARLRKDDLFWEAPITCRSEAADALEAAQAEIERLTTDRRVLQADGKHPAPCAKFCEATAFTIELRRAHAEIEKLREVWLEDGVRASEDRGDLLKERDQALAEIDMHMRVATNAIDHVVTLKAEIEAVRKANVDCVNHFDALRIDYDTALARLAELDKQEPVAEMALVDMGIGDARQLRVNWLMDGYLDVGAKLFAAAGASPQPSQAGELSQQEAEALAHRRASKYAHRSDPSYVAYTFLPHTLMDFVRDVTAAINAKESAS